MFIGREAELQFLNDKYEENKGQLIVLYGRRRVGKTETLWEFCKGKLHIFFSCTQTTDRVQLAKFSKQLLKEDIPARPGLEKRSVTIWGYPRNMAVYTKITSLGRDAWWGFLNHTKRIGRNQGTESFNNLHKICYGKKVVWISAHQAMIRTFIMERFLERVSISEYRDNFILKGGMLVASLVGINLRSTMDIDTTAFATSSSVCFMSNQSRFFLCY